MNLAVSPERISGPLSLTASSSGTSSLSGRSALRSLRRAASSPVSSPSFWNALANKTRAATESGVVVGWMANGLRDTHRRSRRRVWLAGSSGIGCRGSTTVDLVATHTSSATLLALRVNVGFGFLVLGWWSCCQESSVLVVGGVGVSVCGSSEGL